MTVQLKIIGLSLDQTIQYTDNGQNKSVDNSELVGTVKHYF
jgi:hypothetical protein